MLGDSSTGIVQTYARVQDETRPRLGKYAFGNTRKRDIDFLTRGEAENLLAAAKYILQCAVPCSLRPFERV
jgi:hypothetical protein